MPRAPRSRVSSRGQQPAGSSNATTGSSGDVSALSEAQLRSLSVYDLRFRCTEAGLDSSGRKADLVSRLLTAEAPAVSSSASTSTSSSSTTTTSSSGDAVSDALRAQIHAEVTACVSSALQSQLVPLLSTGSGGVPPTNPPPGPAAPPPVVDLSSGGPSSSTGSSQRVGDGAISALTATSGLPPGRSYAGTTGSGTTLTVASSLPTTPIPQRMVDRILKGEFIDFNDLLPEALGCSQPSALQLHASSGDLVQFVVDASASDRVRRHVHDFGTWMVAWTAYLHTVLTAAPLRASELLAYQAIIADASQKFSPDGWLAYDRQFRAAAAREPQRRWDAVDPTTWQLTMTGKAYPPCFSCRLPHPPSSIGRCPFRGAARQQPGPASRAVTPESREVCRNFNVRRCKYRASCRYAHICLNCRGNHPRIDCPTGGGSSAASKRQQQA